MFDEIFLHFTINFILYNFNNNKFVEENIFLIIIFIIIIYY